MVQEVLEQVPECAPPSIHFGCASCGSVLSVPAAMAGSGGPCPLCGEWLVSPNELEARSTPQGIERKPRSRDRVESPPPFAARRQLTPSVPVPPEMALRPQGRSVGRGRRVSHDRRIAWFKRSRARLTVAGLLVVTLTLAYLHSQKWNLPWHLPEDSAVIHFLESLAHPQAGGGELPSGPARRK